MYYSVSVLQRSIFLLIVKSLLFPLNLAENSGQCYYSYTVNNMICFSNAWFRTFLVMLYSGMLEGKLHLFFNSRISCGISWSEKKMWLRLKEGHCFISGYLVFVSQCVLGSILTCRYSTTTTKKPTHERAWLPQVWFHDQK